MLTEMIFRNDCNWVIVIPSLNKFRNEQRRLLDRFGWVLGALLLVFPVFIIPCNLSAQSNHPRIELSSRQMAEFYLFQKRYDDALRSFHEVLEKDKSDSYIFRGLVNAYRGLNRQADGELYLKEYLKNNPRSSNILYGLGYLYYLENRDEEAERYLIQAVDADPGHALALNNLGGVMARKKSFSEAIRLVKSAIEINPQELMFFRNLKIIYDEMDHKQEFSNEFEEYKRKGSSEIAAGYGKTLARILRQKGFQFYSQGKLEKAINNFSELVAIYQKINYTKGLIPGLFSLGLLYEEKGDQARSQGYFRDVLKINPNHIQARKRAKSGKVQTKNTP